MVVWRSRVQTHSVRWAVESLGAVLGGGQTWVVMGYPCMRGSSARPKGSKVSLFSCMMPEILGSNPKVVGIHIKQI